ncbi:MAG: DUF2062 domain-containing protein [Desertifilum sp. SIO1I2]|nr:DUF2062 domain-containing protein [Desertifilum sp. SIO1I2]
MSRLIETEKSAIVRTPKPRRHRHSRWERGWQGRSMANWRQALRYGYLRLMTLEGTPEAIARGVSCGVFAGLFPLFGLQTLIGVALATLLRGNKIAAAAATWISNPLTYLPIYALNFQVGAWLLGTTDVSFTRDNLLAPQQLIQFGGEFLETLFLGCLVMGILCGTASYFLSLRLVRQFRQWQQSTTRRNHPSQTRAIKPRSPIKPNRTTPR